MAVEHRTEARDVRGGARDGDQLEALVGERSHRLAEGHLEVRHIRRSLVVVVVHRIHRRNLQLEEVARRSAAVGVVLRNHLERGILRNSGMP